MPQIQTTTSNVIEWESLSLTVSHDDVIKWKHFPRNWPFVRGIHRSRWIPHTKASHTELWCFFFICVCINGWVNNREAGDLRRYQAHYEVIVMICHWYGHAAIVELNSYTEYLVLPYSINILSHRYVAWLDQALVCRYGYPDLRT